MNYQETITWLFQQLPIYQNQGQKAYKENLGNITKFCDHLGNPQYKFSTIHIAGTNGKGSTSHMTASILQEAGYKTGLHTSPHLKDFRERARINGEVMSQKFVVEFIAEHKTFIQNLQTSFFEINVAMAFQFFYENNVDVAVVETGLGGRLDSTNIIKPDLSIITNIGLDHTAILGETMRDIALEKAGIIKPETPVIIGETTPETKDVFLEKAKELNSPIVFSEECTVPDYETDLKGLYQNYNKRTAIVATKQLSNSHWHITNENIKNGLRHVSKNTGIRGRWDILNKNPWVVADTAHNPDGIKYIIQQIKNTPHKNLHLVLGFVNDKDVKSILSLFPKNAMYYFCEPNVPRKKSISDLRKEISTSIHAQYFNTVDEALSAAKNNADKEDFIYVGGSTFVVAEVV